MKVKSELPAPGEPVLMNAAQMSRFSGIGEATLRKWMETNQLEHLQIGSHRLIAVSSILTFYQHHKTPVRQGKTIVLCCCPISIELHKEAIAMSRKQNKVEITYPLLMTAKQMSQLCGIGENTLRALMADNQLEHLQVGSHRLIPVSAIWDYYERNKVSCTDSQKNSHAVSAEEVR